MLMPWGYLMFLAFSGASTLASGVLMMFDSMKHRVQEEVERAVRRKEETVPAIEIGEKEREHMSQLLDRCEQLRPKYIKEQS